VRGSTGVRLAIATALVALAAPAIAWGHAERPAYFPDPAAGSVPAYRDTGTPRVVCKKDSARRINRLSGEVRKRNLDLLGQCRFDHIQAAVNAAQNGDRILILPGVYREEPSRAAPDPDPTCKDMYVGSEGILGTGLSLDGERTPDYEYQRHCPNAQNLIALVGDKTTAEDPNDTDRKCDDKCNLQIEGTGAGPADVLIEGDRKRLNVIRADRADGIYLKNFTVQYSDFNNIYALETNGFRFDGIVSRWSREYGFLSFTSDNGLYENLEAYGAGDSGVYPGSGPECRQGVEGNARYGIEIKNVNSHGNTIGYSGTAGNGIYAHDNRFHDNATGMTTDSFASGHPGMPQDCAKWERNEVSSNNADLFNDKRDEYCKRPYLERDPTVVCPTFQVPVGTGLLIAGGNDNIVKDNDIYDNWRSGARLMWVPASARGEPPTADQYDTSHRNRFEGNTMGVGSDGTRDPNGVDFWWDEEGQGNCWTGNTGPDGANPTSDPRKLPGCPNDGPFHTGDLKKQASQASCATWDPQENTDPPGCDWFTQPSEPK
jgi:hypothetical protein